MGARQKILVLSNVAWDFVWQRHQTLASLFARDGDVTFCEIPGMRRVGWRDWRRLFSRFKQLAGPAPTDSVPAGVRIVRPFLLPATNAVFCAINRRRLARFVRRDPVLSCGVDLLVNYSPSRTARELIARVPHRRLFYDCTDNFLAMRGIPGFLRRDEAWILARANLTLVPSRYLEDMKRPFAQKIVRVPHGALVERFLVDPRPTNDVRRLTVLYYGHILGQHLDLDAIDTIAAGRPQWRVILVGPVKTPHAFPPNVTLAGQQPHPRLREWVADADVLILPYVLNEYTRAVLPAKTYECLATGRPIVATPLPDLVADFSAHLRFAAKASDWADAVEGALADDTLAARDARIALAKANSWERRYEEIQRLLGE